MRPFTAVLGLATACAACFAAPFLLPLLLGATGLGIWAMGWLGGAFLVGAIASVVFWAALIYRKRTKASAAAGRSACGCVADK
jgi:membrane protein implicated in regulation of membrane protease activity